MFTEESCQPEKSVFYQVRVKKGWFRGKDAFTERLFFYERQLKNLPVVELPLNAGNMIYVMMQRLEAGVDWEKQDLLIASYRNLMYRMSYVKVTISLEEPECLLLSGQKDDILWSLSFLTQAFPDDPMYCQTKPVFDGDAGPVSFSVRNGNYEGKNALQMQTSADALPDIWSFGMDIRTKESVSAAQEQDVPGIPYVPSAVKHGAAFGLPDGRQCVYVRMDDRFAYADQYEYDVPPMIRHQISASLLKDFEDLVGSQTSMDYELYHMRYLAFMNKVHELEKLMGGLEISCYDKLPIGERGLPYASMKTLARTNELECNSLKYLYEKLDRNKNHLNARTQKEILREIGYSVIHRIQGYDMEYQSYQMTGTSESVCNAIRMQMCCELYADFAEIDALGAITFPGSIYRILCNDPVHNAYEMTEWERQKMKLFGRGYGDFLYCQLQANLAEGQRRIYERAWDRLCRLYLEKKSV